MTTPRLLTVPFFYLLTAVLFVTGCQQAAPTADLSAVELTPPHSTWDPSLVTQTHSAFLTVQVLSPTSTSLPTIFQIPTFTPTYVPVSPVPTTTLPPVTPVTPLPLENIRLTGEVFYNPGAGLIDLKDYHFDRPLEITGAINARNPLTLYQGAWSADGKYLALRTTLSPIMHTTSMYEDLGICIFSREQVHEYVGTNRDKYNCIRIYTNIYNPQSFQQGDYAEIKNISWSPDNKYLLVTVKGVNTGEYIITSPCLIEVDTHSVDCHWTNMFWEANNDVLRVIAGAHAISWSPQDKNKLAIPLKTNWLPISEGVENGYNLDTPITPWDLSTDNLKQGLYLVDITPSLLHAYPPENDRILTLL